MKKLVTALFGTLIAGLLNANAATSASVDIAAARDARIEKIRSVTADSPLSFSQSHQANQSMVQWHSSHYSHSSHRSHSSHYSHRSGY